GAVASGLSGTGPAVAAVASEDNVEKIKRAWKKYPGSLIETRVNLEKAHASR
ncbi:shikimate kinase, partial [Candidatus Bathyarchaeota archaeon]